MHRLCSEDNPDFSPTTKTSSVTRNCGYSFLRSKTILRWGKRMPPACSFSIFAKLRTQGGEGIYNIRYFGMGYCWCGVQIFRQRTPFEPIASTTTTTAIPPSPKHPSKPGIKIYDSSLQPTLPPTLRRAFFPRSGDRRVALAIYQQIERHQLINQREETDRRRYLSHDTLDLFGHFLLGFLRENGTGWGKRDEWLLLPMNRFLKNTSVCTGAEVWPRKKIDANISLGIYGDHLVSQACLQIRKLREQVQDIKGMGKGIKSCGWARASSRA